MWSFCASLRKLGARLAEPHLWTHILSKYSIVLTGSSDTSQTLFFQKVKFWFCIPQSRPGFLHRRRARSLPSAWPAGAARPRITPVNILSLPLRHLAHTSWMPPCVFLTHTAKWGPLAEARAARGRRGRDRPAAPWTAGPAGMQLFLRTDWFPWRTSTLTRPHV